MSLPQSAQILTEKLTFILVQINRVRGKKQNITANQNSRNEFFVTKSVFLSGELKAASSSPVTLHNVS